jgi:hypothetical protein
MTVSNDRQVIGREREVCRVMQILARRTKNNPILLGEPGVGKTAIAEGLAYAIVNNVSMDGSPLPAFLQSKRIMQLDVSGGRGVLGGGRGQDSGRGAGIGERVVRLFASLMAA